MLGPKVTNFVNENIPFESVPMLELVSARLALVLSYRTLPTSACQGFSSLLWGKVASVRFNWLFTEGGYEKFCCHLILSQVNYVHNGWFVICVDSE